MQFRSRLDEPLKERPTEKEEKLTGIAAPAVALTAFLLSTLVSLGDPIDRSEVYVKDGDTIIVGPGDERHMSDQEYRLVGFDTPETARGKCPSEIEKGNRATARLIALLESGKLDLTEIECSCPPGTKPLTKDCNRGRRCGRLTVNGKDVGEILIAEGLAVPYVCDPPPATRSRPCPRQKNWCR
jgi:micrococcal nuclease